ncbi:MAG TPA: TIGR04282 family arsenosugar biosynthesis glycosyltransferase [Ktedonobacteraceae bacterium]|nr:TIGR04282 family arsenosugar biosynthesis glycosyltransferase [Ktedonobacteraceae bacterium]
MPDIALVIMARYPQPGTTKTRLARIIGDEETIHLYCAFLTDLAQRFAVNPLCDLYLAYTPVEADYAAFMATLAPSLGQSMRFFPQQGAGLGERLHNAFHWMYERGYRRTILIGSDSPHIDGDIVAHAQEALDKADVVLGPADDGGYYLIAMRRPHDVFRDIPMSTNQVLQMTIELALRQGLRVCTLKTLFDIDDLPDLARLAQLLRADSSLAPATAARLATMKEFV